MRFSLLGVFLCFVVITAGCVFNHKIVNEVSEVDQRKKIKHRGWISTKNNKFTITPYWDSLLKQKVVFKLLTQSYSDIKTITGYSLNIFIDGVKYNYITLGEREKGIVPGTKLSTSEEYESYYVFSYLIDYHVIDKILNGKNIGIKINLINNSSIEDVLVDKDMLIGFRSNIDKVNDNKVKEQTQSTSNDNAKVDLKNSKLIEDHEQTVAPVSTPVLGNTINNSCLSMEVASINANLRKNPSENAGIVMTLKKGTQVNVIKQKDDWFIVELDSGDVGWCHKSILTQTSIK